MIKKTLTCCFIFAATIILLGLPFTQWGFKTDDFSNLYHTSKIQTCSDICGLFNDKSIETFCYSSGVTPPPSSFLSGLYRPLSFIYYLPQYWIFGTNPYGYFLTTIIFHAGNAVLFFLLCLLFVPYRSALLGSLLFAFHPSLHNWLGWISAQTYQIELLVLFLLIICLKKYFETNHYRWYTLSIICYALNLWLKEATFFLPVWMFFTACFYLTVAQQYTIKRALKKSLRIAIGFLGVSISYFIARALVFGFASQPTQGNLTFTLSWSSFIARQKSRIYDFISYVCDMLGLSLVPHGNQLLKGCLLLSITICLIWFFMISNHKRLLLFLYISTLLFSWPALLMHYQPRYIYLALPFFILALLVSCMHVKNSILPLAVLIICCNVVFLNRKLKAREQALHAITVSFKTLIDRKECAEQPLFFFGLPHHWFAMCIAQAVWFLSGIDNVPVYHDGSLVEVIGYENYLCFPRINNHFLHIQPVSKGFLLTSHNPDMLWFSDTQNPHKTPTTLIKIPDTIQQKNPTYITWDYYYGKFTIINHDHSHVV